jgi:hypothetical protein
MKMPPVFASYCLLILLAFSVAKYQGLSLLGSAGQAAAGSAAGGTRGSGGSSGSHK